MEPLSPLSTPLPKKARVVVLLSVALLVLSHLCIGLTVYIAMYLSVDKRLDLAERNIQEIVQGFNQYVQSRK